MITINRVLFQLLVLFCVCSCAANTDKAVSYKAIVIDEIAGDSLQKSYIDTIVIDEINGYVKYDSGRVVIELTDCGNENWKCISDGSLEFAIPKNGKVSKINWSYRDINYSVIKIDGNAVTSKSYFILAEQKPSADRKIPSKIFLYSESKGILGITMLQSQSLIPVTYMRDDIN